MPRIEIYCPDCCVTSQMEAPTGRNKPYCRDCGKVLPTSAMRPLRYFYVANQQKRGPISWKQLRDMVSDHVVIYGSSKQGKTSLRQMHIKESDCTVINCSPKAKPEDIYMSMLRIVEITLRSSEKKLTGSKTTISGKGGMSFLAGSVAREGSEGSEVVIDQIPYDLSDAHSVCELLQNHKISRFFVLENFHYLPIETQKVFSHHLRTFHENSIRFIILGVWKDVNLLTTHCSDLSGRISEINVEPWEESDFDRVINSGCQALNITISEEIIDLFNQNAVGNIGLLQKFLHSFCFRSGITATQKELTQLEDKAIANDIRSDVLKEQEGVMLRSLQQICTKKPKGDEPNIFLYYLVRVILSMPIDKVQRGLTPEQLLEEIQGIHHKDSIRSANSKTLSLKIKELLHNDLRSAQKDMTPPLFFLDTKDKRLKIVDGWMLFVLINADREEMASQIPNPLD